MNYVEGYQDHGIIIRPDKEGEPFFSVDGGGIREAIINRENGKYYLFYDGAIPGARPDSYWMACLAESEDLVHWKKLGRVLNVSPDGSGALDTRTATSPWVYFDGERWHMYYIGSPACSEEGVPACPYYTLYASAGQLTGPWKKRIDEPGKEKHVCFMTKPNSWMDFTASAGHVLENPNWQGPGDRENDRYIMYFSGSCLPPMERSLGIATTTDLARTDDYDAPAPNHWHIQPEPILPPEIDLENSSVYYEEANGTYFLFTNHIKDNSYTDAVYVYSSKDPFHWDPACGRILVDASNSAWAHGAIGMPTVIKTAPNTLSIVYDGVEGSGCGHLNRCIGLGTLPLPLKPFEKIPLERD